MLNNKGYSIGFSWLFALISLFGIGLMYIVFDQVYMQYLAPAIKNAVAMGTIEEATKLQIYANIDKYLVFFHALPFILFFCVVIYLIVVSIRKEKVDDF